MKNNIYILILFILFNINSLCAFAGEQFNFDVTEIEITDNGNIFKGLKRGVVTTNDGIELKADEFEYNKNTNVKIIIKVINKLFFIYFINHYAVNN